jgi:hypothetical protein
VRAASRFLYIEKRVTSRHPYFYATSVGAAAALCFAVIACCARVYHGTWMRNALIGAGRFPPSSDSAVTVHATLGVLVTLVVVVQGYLGSVEERDWHGNVQAGRHRRWHRKFGWCVCYTARPWAHACAPHAPTRTRAQTHTHTRARVRAHITHTQRTHTHSRMHTQVCRASVAVAPSREQLMGANAEPRQQGRAPARISVRCAAVQCAAPYAASAAARCNTPRCGATGGHSCCSSSWWCS